MDVYDFHVGVGTQVLAQFGDVNVHAAGIEVVVVHPDCLESEVALQNFVGVFAKQLQ